MNLGLIDKMVQEGENLLYNLLQNLLDLYSMISINYRKYFILVLVLKLEE